MSLSWLLIGSASGACVPDFTASCHTADIVAITDVDDSQVNSCDSTAPLVAADHTYRFDPPAGAEVYVDVVPTGTSGLKDIDLLVENDTCACVDASINADAASFAWHEFVSFTSTGDPYYVTIDNSPNANTGVEYRLGFGCAEPCTNDIDQTRTCGFHIAGDTNNGANNISFYECMTPTLLALTVGARFETGPEVVYEFVPELTGRIGIELSKFLYDHDLIVLEGTCEQSSCIDHSATDASTDFLQMNVTAGTTYYIVVDARAGVPGPFELRVEYLDGQSCGEVCDNGVDDDNNGLTDCDDPNCDDNPFCCDMDDDGVKNATCGGDDCDDLEPATAPQFVEICDDIDNDCDGSIDEDLDKGIYYADEDRDSWGDDDTEIDGCPPDDTWVQRGGDCNDDDNEVFPERSEVCDGKDNDCDETTEKDAGCPGNTDSDFPAQKKGCGCASAESGLAGSMAGLFAVLAMSGRRQR